MKFFRSFLSFLVLSILPAQALVVKPNVAPVVTGQIGNYDQLQGPTRIIDLSQFFNDPDASAAAQLVTSLGTMNFTLDGATTPITVANFLNYLNSGRYFTHDNTTNSQASLFVHRAVSNFVIQSGGFLGTENPDHSGKVLATQVTPFAAIQNEPVISNRRGTIAMAKVDGNPNSATSQWFINLADNSAGSPKLDTQNGGFTVFGRVAGNGMNVADAIAALPKVNATAPFDSLPVRNYTSPNPIKVPNLVSIPTLTEISPLTYSASSSNSAAAGVTISGKNLLVEAKQVGSSNITVTATDLDGAAVSQMFTVNVVPAQGRLVNVSSRVNIGTGNDVLIAGFIVGGSTTPKRLVIRVAGPSLQGIPNVMSDPTLSLLDDTNTVIATNDNWVDSPDKQELLDLHINPTADKEPALIKTVAASSTYKVYTAIVKGVGGTSGVGVVELYDLDSLAGSTLLNISSRGHIGSGASNAMFGGWIVGGSESRRLIIRSLGPSLNVPGTLADPTLEVRDANGTIIDSNDDWQSNPNAAEIGTSGVAPNDPKESATALTLTPALYTAIVRGKNGATGIATIEAYKTQ